MSLVRLLFVCSVLSLSACASLDAPPAPVSSPPSEVDAETGVPLTLLHFNDVYEITPVEGGASGGLARVATLKRRLEAEAPVITLLAGDFLSPSALGTAEVDGERLAGRQMVAVLNAVGVDAAALGNHEFDLSENAFRARMTEASFPMLSANAHAAPGHAPFPNVEPYRVFRVTSGQGAHDAETVRIGVVSVVLPSNDADYVRYDDALARLSSLADSLDAETDVLIGLTHLTYEEDLQAAENIPALDMVLGGHEHENIQVRRGPNWTPVMKADANARTVWVHRLTAFPNADSVAIRSELLPITRGLPDDPEVGAEVDRWLRAAYAGFRENGFEPARLVTHLGEPLDGREAQVRNRQTNLGRLIATGFAEAAGTEAALFNSGSIRVDDVLPEGGFTEYDAIRVLPFGGEVLSIRLPGDLLERVLEQGVENRGSGGYLQLARISRSLDGDGWSIGDEKIEDDGTYVVATSDFLVSGRETGLDYFNAETNPDIEIVGRHGDVRRALISELVARYGRAVEETTEEPEPDDEVPARSGSRGW